MFETMCVYLDGKYFRIVPMVVTPIPGDRLVFDDDAYKGYIVEARTIKPREIIIHCREDK